MHGTPKSAVGARLTCLRAFRIESEFGSVGFCGEGKSENILSEPTTNSTQATLAGGERSHHCTTPPP